MTINRLRQRIALAALTGAVVIAGGLGVAVRANAAAVPQRPTDVLTAVETAQELESTKTASAGVVVAVVAVTNCEPERLTALAPEGCP